MTRMFLLICALLTTACGTAATHSAPPDATASSARVVLAEWWVTGGMCPDGRCEDRFTVWSDGTWRRELQARVSAEGQLTAVELADLRHAVRTTTLTDAPPAATGCAADADGKEFTYTIGTVVVSSCRNVLPTGDPLPKMLEELRARSD
jgi:hypothetical protein